MGSREGSSGFDEGTSPLGNARRGRSARAFRQAFVAIRYSQVRTLERDSKPPAARQALRRVSWTRSSASWSEPTMR